MSIRNSILCLLEQKPRYGYELKQEFESLTADTWPLNIGQIYTTLDRLDRDGLVRSAGTDGDGHIYYEITDAGRKEVSDWFTHPVDRAVRSRDELTIKLAMALAVPGTDVRELVQRQRSHTQKILGQYTRLKRHNRAEDLAWSLVLESNIFAAEAEIRWLDYCEATLLESSLLGAAPRLGRSALPKGSSEPPAPRRRQRVPSSDNQ